MKRIITLLAVILTANLGRVQFQGHDETWYNLPMQNVIKTAISKGIEDDYWERKDGCKMYGKYVICAANYNIHPYGSIVETSRGLGITLDTGDFAKTEPTTIDIATTW